MSPCPSPETLGRLAQDSSGSTRFSATEAHVEACLACLGVLERLAADSSAYADHERERLPPGEEPPTIPGGSSGVPGCWFPRCDSDDTLGLFEGS
jgi:hypothetical protein